MATVYIVTSGSYSDYSIDAVFSTRGLADAYVEELRKAKGDAPDVEEWPLDEQAGAIAATIYGVRIFLTSGNVEHRWQYRRMVQPNDRVVGDPCSFKRALDVLVEAHSAVSPEHALKVAAEKRQEILREKAQG